MKILILAMVLFFSKNCFSQFNLTTIDYGDAIETIVEAQSSSGESQCEIVFLKRNYKVGLVLEPAYPKKLSVDYYNTSEVNFIFFDSKGKKHILLTNLNNMYVEKIGKIVYLSFDKEMIKIIDCFKKYSSVIIQAGPIYKLDGSFGFFIFDEEFSLKNFTKCYNEFFKINTN